MSKDVNQGSIFSKPMQCFCEVVPFLPFLLQDDGDHRLDEKGVGPGPQRDVQVRDLRRFRFPRVDDGQELVRIRGEFPEHEGGARHLVAFHAVPPDGHDHVRMVLVRDHVAVLAAEHPSAHPEVSGELLRERAVVIARAEAFHEGRAEARLEVASLPAPAHVHVGARAVLFHDGCDLFRDLRDRLLPGYPDKSPVRLFQGMREAVRVVLMPGHIGALDAHVALAARIGFIAPDLTDRFSSISTSRPQFCGQRTQLVFFHSPMACPSCDVTDDEQAYHKKGPRQTPRTFLIYIFPLITGH